MSHDVLTLTSGRCSGCFNGSARITISIPVPTLKLPASLTGAWHTPYLAYAVRFLITPFTALVPAGTFGTHADMGFVWAVVAGRTTSLILSTATIVVIYRLAAQAFDVESGLVAALVAALSTLFVQLAHFATPDSLTVFLVSCTLLAAVRVYSEPNARRFAMAGTLLGLTHRL